MEAQMALLFIFISCLHSHVFPYSLFNVSLIIPSPHIQICTSIPYLLWISTPTIGHNSPGAKIPENGCC